MLVVSATSPLADADEFHIEELVNEPFVARKSTEEWRNFWLAVDSRGGMPVHLGAEVSTVDECFEAILSERGIAFTQASTQRFYGRPGLVFIPVVGIPDTALSISWRNDVDSPLIRDFIDTAAAVASLTGLPGGHTVTRFSSSSLRESTV